MLGVDGCPGGWIVATVTTDGGGELEIGWRLAGPAREILDHADAVGARVVAIDIPVGLSDGPPRECDREARRALGRAGSSVFPAPPRQVLAVRENWVESRRVAVAATGGPSISKQLWYLLDRIADVDEVMSPQEQQRTMEVHPELALRRMGGVTDLPPKRLVAGRQVRLEILRSWLPDPVATVAAAPRPAKPDDAIDALACAWSALRVVAGTAEVHGDPGFRDSGGLQALIRA